MRLPWEMVLFRRRSDIASMAFSFTSCSVAISSHHYSPFKQSQDTVMLLLSPQRRPLPSFLIPQRVFACGHGHASVTLYRSTGAHPTNDVVPSLGLLLVDRHPLKQLSRALPGEAEPGSSLVRSAPLSQCLSSLLTGRHAGGPGGDSPDLPGEGD
jgi:hypothetical protein